MYTISKITSHSAIDFAAEELRKYLRMMMPECGNIEVKYDTGGRLADFDSVLCRISDLTCRMPLTPSLTILFI